MPTKFRVDKKGRECTGCGVYKTWPKFWKSKYPKHLGGHTPSCKECENKRTSSRRKMGGVSDVDLSVLTNHRIKRQNEWTYQQAALLAKGLTKEFQKHNYDLEDIFKKYGSEKKFSTCKAMYTELKRAAKEKMTLKEYWDGGRKFSTQYLYGKRELVPATKK